MDERELENSVHILPVIPLSTNRVVGVLAEAACKLIWTVSS